VARDGPPRTCDSVATRSTPSQQPAHGPLSPAESSKRASGPVESDPSIDDYTSSTDWRPQNLSRSLDLGATRGPCGGGAVPAALLRVDGPSELAFAGLLAVRAGFLRAALAGMDWGMYDAHGIHFEWAIWLRILQLCGPDGWPGAAGGGWTGSAGRVEAIRNCRLVRAARLGLAARSSARPEPVMW
jgi:hypothetical protein